jgi:hypothetical protein
MSQTITGMQTNTVLGMDLSMVLGLRMALFVGLAIDIELAGKLSITPVEIRNAVVKLDQIATDFKNCAALFIQ